MFSKVYSIAFPLFVAFISLVVGLLYIVTRVFKARGWHEIGTSARPIVIRSRAISRVIGVLFVMAGCGFVAWSWNDAHTSQFFSFKMAALGPAMIGIGGWVAIEGPLTEDQRMSVLGWILSGLGIGAGLLYSQFLGTGRVPFLSQ